jgi:hypothetical protein
LTGGFWHKLAFLVLDLVIHHSSFVVHSPAFDGEPIHYDSIVRMDDQFFADTKLNAATNVRSGRRPGLR